jgi:hypothetical protein
LNPDVFRLVVASVCAALLLSALALAGGAEWVLRGPAQCARCARFRRCAGCEQPGLWLGQQLCVECELRAEVEAGQQQGGAR